MATRIKASTKGQVVLPKRTRDRLGIVSGTELDVVDTVAGVELLPVKTVASTGVDAAIDRLQQIVSYKGPRLDESAWQRGLDAAIRTKWDRRSG